MYGLGKALLAGTQAFTDQRDLIREREKQALQMALMKEQEARAAQKANLEEEQGTFNLAHSMASALPDGSAVDDTVGERFKQTPFFTKDPNYLPDDNIGADDSGQRLPLPPDPQGRQWRSMLPVDSKASLQQNSLQNALAKAQINSLDKQSEWATRQGMNTQDNDFAKQVALITAVSRMGAAQNNQPDLEGIAQSVEQHPEIMDQLPMTVKAKIIPMLSQRGFNDFGKALTTSEVAHLADQQLAKKQLQQLRDIIAENQQYIGPFAGLSRLNPYSRAAQIQADLNRNKQTTGKTLEGGVLRKEDEEKYKYILATMMDTPETALYKIDQLINDFDKAAETRRTELRAAGRRVAPMAAESDPPASAMVVGPDGKVRRQ